jgi:hypothetical protein
MDFTVISVAMVTLVMLLLATTGIMERNNDEEA